MEAVSDEFSDQRCVACVASSISRTRRYLLSCRRHSQQSDMRIWYMHYEDEPDESVFDC